MRYKIYHLLEKGSHGSRVNLYFDYFIMILIVLNVAEIAIESVSSINQSTLKFLKIFELFSIGIFTIEYILRVFISDLVFPGETKFKSAIKFILSPFGIIDILAIIPFYLPFLIPIDLRFIRIVRLIRFVRIFKITRYNNALKLIGDVFYSKRKELGMTFFIAAIVLIVASFLMYLIEGTVQPDKFPNVFASMWWAIVTLTTIGYGDVFPVTTGGKILSSLVSIMGIGLIALPTGILSSGFVDHLKDNKSIEKTKICPHCGKQIE